MILVYIYIYIYIYMVGVENVNKFDGKNIFLNMKKQSIQNINLFMTELLANVRRLGCYIYTVLNQNTINGNRMLQKFNIVSFH